MTGIVVAGGIGTMANADSTKTTTPDSYAVFQSALTQASRSEMDSAREIRRLLKGLRYTAVDTFAASWTRYQVSLAARHPAFIDGVQQEVTRNRKAGFLKQLRSTSGYIWSVKGAKQAATQILDQIRADNERMVILRERFLQAAQRLSSGQKGLYRSPLQQKNDPVPVRAPQNTGPFRESLMPVTPAYASSSPLMERILVTAAHQIAGNSGASIAPGSGTTRCLNWARLNLNQCLAASHFPSEKAWCTGNHAIEEVRACWASSLPGSQR